MAVIAMEGFDALTPPLIINAYPISSEFSASVTAGRFGGQAYIPGPTNQNGAFVFSVPTLQTMSTGAALYFPATALAGAGSGIATIRYQAAAGRQFSVGVNSAGAVMVGNGTTLTLATSAAGVITGKAYHYWEVELFVHDTLGTVKVLIDGVAVINLTNVDTRGRAEAATVTSLSFTQAGMGVGGFRIDDAYLKDDLPALGPQRIETLRPESDVSAAWTPNSGANNYSRVSDSVSDGDTTYVTSATATTRDRYGLTNLSDTPSSIAAVAAVMIARMTDAGPRTVRVGLHSGSADSWSAAQAMTSSYVARQVVVEKDPATSAAWTPSGVNALQAQIEVVS